MLRTCFCTYDYYIFSIILLLLFIRFFRPKVLFLGVNVGVLLVIINTTFYNVEIIQNYYILECRMSAPDFENHGRVYTYYKLVTVSLYSRS